MNQNELYSNIRLIPLSVQTVVGKLVSNRYLISLCAISSIEVHKRFAEKDNNRLPSPFETIDGDENGNKTNLQKDFSY